MTLVGKPRKKGMDIDLDWIICKLRQVETAFEVRGVPLVWSVENVPV